MRKLFLTLLFAASTSTLFAQLQGTLAPKPIGIAFARNMTQQSMMSYVGYLTEQLEFGQTMFGMMNSEEMKKRWEDMTPKVDDPVAGTAFYMVQGLIPSFANVSFQSVKDEADALRFLKAQGKMMGGQGESVKDEGNGCYLFSRSNSWDQPVQKGQDAQKQVEEINNRNTGHQFKNTAELVEKDGKQVIKRTWTMTTYYRYSDSLLFSSEYRELWDMDLPTTDSLMSSVEGENDLGAEAFFDRIPTAIKTLGWNMLSSAAGVQMQQRDGEHEAIATLRESSMQFGLDLVRAVMFDVDEANGWLKWADDEVQSVRGELDFSTRRNSSLTLKLEEMSSANSRFGPLLSDESPGMFHVCVKLFEDNDPMVRAAADWIVHSMDEISGGSDELSTAARDVAVTLENISEERTLEVFGQAGWSEETNGFLMAGLQVDSNANLLSAINAFLEWTNKQSLVELSLTDREGRRVIEIGLPDSVTGELSKQTGLKLSHAYIAHENNCIWIVFGGENGHMALWQAVAQCESRGLATRTPLVTATIDVEQWLSLPQDDPVGVGGLLTWMDENQGFFPPTPMSFGPRSSGEPTPLLQRCLDLGGDRRGSFKVIADKGGLQASATLGEALGNYYVARMIDSQDRMMKRSREQAEKRMKQAKEKAATPQPAKSN